MKVLPLKNTLSLEYALSLRTGLCVTVLCSAVVFGSAVLAEDRESAPDGFGSNSRSEYRGEQLDVDSADGERSAENDSRGRMDETKWGTISAGDKFGSLNLDKVGNNVGEVVGAVGGEIKRSTSGSADKDSKLDAMSDSGHNTGELDTNSDLR